MGRKKNAVKIDPVLLSFKEKFQVVTTTEGTMQRLMTSAHDPQATVDEQSEQVKLQCEQVHLKWSACCLRPLRTTRGRSFGKSCRRQHREGLCWVTIWKHLPCLWGLVAHTQGRWIIKCFHCAPELFASRVCNSSMYLWTICAPSLTPLTLRMKTTISHHESALDTLHAAPALARLTI